ncbi:hypothetical protein M413DRAFT_285455 [Hebeloma cylindrosporum]|uniref:Uncharacterized protein n=1 Tax=Hebeloma cylindrosporum TaxID=76867 RepID=A0A0C3BJD9_HEBCY|nr:hypothetical protein M413DRAFT_285455 [Hebeloma cylindrosporum h7]
MFNPHPRKSYTKNLLWISPAISPKNKPAQAICTYDVGPSSSKRFVPAAQTYRNFDIDQPTGSQLHLDPFPSTYLTPSKWSLIPHQNPFPLYLHRIQPQTTPSHHHLLIMKFSATLFYLFAALIAVVPAQVAAGDDNNNNDGGDNGKDSQWKPQPPGNPDHNRPERPDHPDHDQWCDKKKPDGGDDGKDWDKKRAQVLWGQCTSLSLRVFFRSSCR